MMKKILLAWFLSITVFSFAQISLRCTTCPPSGVGNTGKMLVSDGSVTAVWGTAAGGLAWTLTGNSGTSPSTNFIGTVDSVDLVFKINNKESGRIDADSNNTSLGYRTLEHNLGTDNTALGYVSLYANTTGISNVAVGSIALNSNTTGINNVAVGTVALQNNTTGNYNIAIGQAALNNHNGSGSVAVGDAALFGSLTGDDNTAIGRLTLHACDTCNHNTAVGDEAGTSFSLGHYNSFFGAEADATGASVAQATAIGAKAKANNGSIALGYNVQSKANEFAIPDIISRLHFPLNAPLTSGNVLTFNPGDSSANWQPPTAGWNLTGNAGTNPATDFLGTTDAIGLYMRVNNVQAGIIEPSSSNVGFGYDLFTDPTATGTAGTHNTAIGAEALASIGTGGNNNVAIGESALTSLVATTDNTAIGYIAGNIGASYTHCTFVGSGAAGVDGSNNSIALGNGASFSGSNQFAIGTQTELKFELNGQVAGKVITTNGTTANWQYPTLLNVKDTLTDLTTGTITLTNNSTNVIVASGAITATTLAFPTGADNDIITINLTQAVTTLNVSGTNTATITNTKKTTSAIGGTTTFNCIGGNWY